MKNLSLIYCAFFWVQIVVAQQPITVTEQTIKIGGSKEEEIYFGFAEGDKIIFSFTEINKKELKEVEVLEYPDNSRFSDFKTSKVEDKSINVLRQSVYIFRFKNSGLSGRICKIVIQRIPESDETKYFNSSVKWVTKQDTSWNTYTKDVVIGYDTSYQQKLKHELINTELKEEFIMDKSERIKAINGYNTSLYFTLPGNQVSNNITKKVTAWAYWVGVGEEANSAWKTNSQTVKGLVKASASYFITPLGAFALGAVMDLFTPKMGEDVNYSVTDKLNRDQFLLGNQYKVYDQGKGVAAYKKFTSQNMCQGTWFICLTNDNLLQPIDVNVKIAAIIETSYFEDKPYTETNVVPKYEKKLFSDPVIKTSRLPVTGY